MSINAVEQTPDGPDIIHIADPGHDAIAEPSGGETANDAITRIPQHGKSRDLRNHPAFAGMDARHNPKHGAARKPDIDAVLTGYPENAARDLHDEAVQVRQLLPSDWDVHQVIVNAVVPIQLMDQRPERITLQVFNNGPATLYLGPVAAKAGITTGFPLASGATIIMNNLGRVWASIDTGTGAQADVRVVESWRSDNGGS